MSLSKMRTGQMHRRVTTVSGDIEPFDSHTSATYNLRECFHSFGCGMNSVVVTEYMREGKLFGVC